MTGLGRFWLRGFLAQMLPGAVLGPFAGVFVDRWDRRRTMVICDLLRAAVLLPLVLVAFGGPLWLVFAVVAAESAVSTFFLPARDAIIPSLVGESHLASANSLKALSEGVPSFIGPLVGVALLGLIGFGGLILVDIASYLASAIAIWFISTRRSAAQDDPEIPATEESPTSAVADTLRELVSGFGIVRRNSVVKVVFVVVTVASLGEGVFMVLPVIFFREVMNVGAEGFGYWVAGYGIGGIAGGLLTGWISARIGDRRLFSLSLVANGVLLIAMFNVGSLPVMVVLAALAGATVVGWFVGAETLIQKRISDEYLGRAFGAFEALQLSAMLIGIALTPLLVQTIGTVAALSAFGGVWSIAGLLSLVILRPGMDTPDEPTPGATVQDPEPETPS